MSVRILNGDARQALAALPEASVDCCVTSPPYYGLRDYGVNGQIGLEATPNEYITTLVEAFREVRRVLKPEGTVWLNLGDSYTANGIRQTGRNDEGPITNRRGGSIRGGPKAVFRSASASKSKDLLMIPARVALALQADGWWLRSEIIWAKPNPMPESVTDRPTSAHEKIYLLAKSARYFFDAEAVKENGKPESAGRYKYAFAGGPEGRQDPNGHERICPEGMRDFDGMRNIRNVWTVATHPYPEAHFATFPPALIEPCIKAGCPNGGTVIDPFGGSGTTGLVADRLSRNAILIELNPEYAEMARRRIAGDSPLFAEVS